MWETQLQCTLKVSRCNRFYRASSHADARYWHSNSVCPSRSGIALRELNIITISSPHGGPIIIVLWVSNIFAKFWRAYTLHGCYIQVRYKNLGFSTNNSLYLAIDTRYKMRWEDSAMERSQKRVCDLSKSKSRSLCSPTLTGNSHQRAHGVPTYALRNSYRWVFRRRQNEATDSCLSWSDAGSEFHAVSPAMAKPCRP